MTIQTKKRRRVPGMASGAPQIRFRDPGFSRKWPKWIAVAFVMSCFGHDAWALDGLPRNRNESSGACHQAAYQSNDFCPKPIPCLAPPKMTSRPGDYCAKPAPWIAIPAESRCPDDYCSKPTPKLCRFPAPEFPAPEIPAPENEPAPAVSKPNPGVRQTCRFRTQPFLVVGGSDCEDDYCRKPKPCLTWPLLSAPTDCKDVGCACKLPLRK